MGVDVPGAFDAHAHATDGIGRGIHGLRYIPYGGIVQGMDDKIRKSSLARLARIEGQVRGVARMIEDERYCIDVLTQIRAVRAALDKVEQETLSDHLKHCVAHAFHAGSEGDRQTKIDELLDVLHSRRR